jgi:peptide/nickel transport system substrate-binding protein
MVLLSLLLVVSGLGGAVARATPAAAQDEKTLVYVTPSLALTLDPCFLPGAQTAEIIQNLYWPWTNYNQIDGPNGIKVDDTASGESKMQPGVLDKWEVSDDQKVWTLHIRPGVKDNYGNELTADDMVWILKRLRAAGGCTFIIDAMNIQDVDKQVKILDDHTVQVTLPSPNPIFLRALNVNNGMPFGPEARKHATADDPWALEWMKHNAPAIGPYMLESWDPGVQMVLVRNPSWFGPPPDIGRIMYRQVPESANRVALLVSGDAQIARDLTQDELDTLDQAPGVHAQCIAANQFVYVALNFEEGKPTADLKVRQALAYAVPYQDIIDSVYRGRAKPLYGFATDTYADFIGADAFPYKTDYDKAKSLLAESAYPNGFDATILVDAGVPEHERIAVLLKDSFAKIGVNLTIDKKPTAAHREFAFGRKFGDMVLDQNYAFIVDPDYHALTWLPNGPPPNFNYGNFTDKEFNQIQAEGVALPEGPERTKLMKRLQEIAIEQLPWLSMANAPTCFGMSDKVQGYIWHTHNQLMFNELSLSQ